MLLGRCGFGWGGIIAGQREILSLVGLDGVEEGGVVGGLISGDLAVQEIDMAPRGDYAGLDVVPRCEASVGAVHDRACGDFDTGT